MENFTVFSINSGPGSSLDALENLLTRAKSGEEEAFGELYDLYFKKIYKFIYYRVSHKEVAEDLAEDVFVKAHTKLSSLSENNSFEGWLYQIARNLVIDYYREKKSTIALEEIENTLEYETNIVDIVSLKEQQKVLIKLLKELTSDQQAVIKLKFFEDLDNPEIATLLGKEEGAVRVIQHRAIARLQELIHKLFKPKD
jgi:RNA polymerase sigma-70 factor, ECF subfamily